ncbi:MAG: helix-turn-helix transcriptional regulator [Eubacteriaceae bacterium]|nr:helix-turn-helix transcriptional regulator [Eubacteriaceae bacterium]
MDQEKTGRFISHLRKEKGLTQAALAEMLGITDKAVSKWETGRSLPDAGIISELCGILGISINEFFAGERIEERDMVRRSEENMLSAVESIRNSKTRYRRYGALYGTGLGMIVTSVLVDDSLRIFWVLFALNLISFAMNRFSVKEQKMGDIVAVMSVISLAVSIVITSDLLINYLWGIYHASLGTEGIGMYSVFGRIIFGDRLWSVEGYLKVFVRALWVSVFFIIENAVIWCSRILNKNRTNI